MNLLKWIPFFVIGATSESVAQIFLKKGASENSEIRGLGYYIKLLKNKWIIGALLVFLVDMIIWVILLANIPLSIAFPLSGMEKIIVIFITVFILKEKVNKLEWFGIGLIFCGIIVIIQSV